jgi:hypothetical protein
MHTFPRHAPGIVVPSFAVFALLFSAAESLGEWRPIPLTANPSSVNLGSVRVGGSSTQYVTITNLSSNTRTITRANLAGDDFKIRGLALPCSLGPAASITFTVIFSPVAVRNAVGSLSIALDSHDVSSLAIAVSGTGTAPASLSLQPASLNFGSVAVGSTKTLKAMLTANGAPAVISSATTSNLEFTVTGLSLPITLAAGQSLPFSVHFRPRSSGSANGTLTFSGNASTRASAQAVSGTGTVPKPRHVSLSWSPKASVAGYNIYRGRNPGGPYTKLNSEPSPTSSFSDNSVKGGQTYYYVVTSVDSSGSESGYSNETRAVVANN